MKYLEHERDFIPICLNSRYRFFFVQMREIKFFFIFFTQYTQLFPSVHPFFSRSDLIYEILKHKIKIKIKIYETNSLYICKFAHTLLFLCKTSLFENNEYYIKLK